MPDRYHSQPFTSEEIDNLKIFLNNYTNFKKWISSPLKRKYHTPCTINLLEIAVNTHWDMDFAQYLIERGACLYFDIDDCVPDFMRNYILEARKILDEPKDLPKTLLFSKDLSLITPIDSEYYLKKPV